MADRLRACTLWLFVAGIVGSLWFYADARSAVARTPKVLPPPEFPSAHGARHWTWQHDLAGDEALGVSDVGELDQPD